MGGNLRLGCFAPMMPGGPEPLDSRLIKEERPLLGDPGKRLWPGMARAAANPINLDVEQQACCGGRP